MHSSFPEPTVSDLADIKRAEQGVFLVLVCTVVPTETPFFFHKHVH
jgi:hypothetical protein